MSSIKLGTISTRRQFSNDLSEAFHPLFGFVWSDGRHVFLMSIPRDGNFNTSCVSQKLGEYRKVTHLGWSSGRDEDSVFLAVGEDDCITIWKVDGEAGIKLHDIAGGGTLTLEYGSSGLSCWSRDGQKLIVVHGRTIKIIVWSNFQSSWGEYVMKEVILDGYRGNPKSVVFMTSDTIAIATELPLADVINQSQEDMFVPELWSSKSPPLLSKPLIAEIEDNSISQTDQQELDISSPISTDTKDFKSDLTLTDAVKEEITKIKSGPIDLTSMISVFSSKQSASSNIPNHHSCLSSEGIGKKVPNVCVGSKNSTPCLVGEQVASLFVEESAGKKLELKSAGGGWNAVTGGGKGEVPVFKQNIEKRVEDSAYLHIVEMKNEPFLLQSVSVPGILVPNLLAFQSLKQCVLVGGSSISQLSIFTYINERLKCSEDTVNLSANERPLGVSCHQDSDIISVLVAKLPVSSMDSSFPVCLGKSGDELFLKQFHI